MLDGMVQFDPQVYERTASFDHAGRGIALTLPRDFTWDGATGTEPTIGGALEFNAGSLPSRAVATICADGSPPCIEQEVVHSIEYTRDGLPRTVVWGDAEGDHDATESTTTYDVRRRAVRMRMTIDHCPGSEWAPEPRRALSRDRRRVLVQPRGRPSERRGRSGPDRDRRLAAQVAPYHCRGSRIVRHRFDPRAIVRIRPFGSV